MAPSTKQALAASLKKLLEIKNLDDITVKELVEDCEVNRQTFYYHFQDIYDLLHWFLDNETNQALKNSTSWHDSLLRAFYYARDNQLAVYHVLRSTGRNYLDVQFYNLARHITYGVICECSQQLGLAEKDLSFLADFYMYALAGLMLDWMFNDMKEEPEALVGRIVRLLDGEFQRSARKFAPNPG